jgi:hypothetical protein
MKKKKRNKTMQQTTTKTNKLKFIPTELNYFHIIYKKTQALRKQGNTSRLLIIALIIWNIILTFAVIPNNSTIPHFTDKQNEKIMVEEFIPPYDLAPIEE